MEAESRKEGAALSQARRFGRINGMIEFTEQQFKEVKEKGEELYKSLGEVQCPFLKRKFLLGRRVSNILNSNEERKPVWRKISI